MATPVTRSLHDPFRLASLHRTALLDSPPEDVFDRLTRRAVAALDATAAMVTLVDDTRQFFKSSVGLPEPWASRRETPLSHSFCKYTVAVGQLIVIDDARRYPSLRRNGAIRDLGVVAYVGVPLTLSNGHVLGDLCAIDGRPRSWTDVDLAILRALAALATLEIDQRLSAADSGRVVALDPRREMDPSPGFKQRLMDAATRELRHRPHGSSAPKRSSKRPEGRDSTP